jgi:hypothetical protein
MTFPRQLRPALFYYRTSCTYRYDYLSPTDSWSTWHSKTDYFQQIIASKKSADYYSHFFNSSNSAN